VTDGFKFKVMDINRRKIVVPEEHFESVITMPSTDFQKYCRDMSHIGEVVDIRSVDQNLSMTVRGDFAEQEKIIGTSDAGVSFLRSSRNVVQGRFSLRCLVMFSKCTNLCSNVEILMKNNYPLIVRYQVANLGEIKLALAPYVENR